MESIKLNQSFIYELNTRIFCIQNNCTLSKFPAFFFESKEFLAADYVWLMGIWKPSPASTKIASTHEGLNKHFSEILPDITSKDIIGSPYSIYDYFPNPLCAENFAEILKFKEKINLLGKKLILDFVPNHMSVDTPLLDSHPELFLYKKEENPTVCKNSYLRNGKVYFYGRDPFFDGWTDTVQWNFANPDTTFLHEKILLKIASVCDGVRCDMAMLPEPDVFERTHGQKAVGYWEPIINSVRAKFPAFQFIAEVYWNMEYTLQLRGFSYTYDKTLYDRLISFRGVDIRSHISADIGYQERSLRFIENHDEDRAEHTLKGRSIDCFSLISFLPGMILYHEGQAQGFTTKLPVQLARRKKEEVNQRILEYYARAFQTIINRKQYDLKFFRGNLKPYGWEDLSNVIVFILEKRALEKSNLVSLEVFIMNTMEYDIHGKLELPTEILDNFAQDGAISLKDIRDNITYYRDVTTIKNEGLFIKLNQRQSHWFLIEK